jgi:hypothetical protein
MKNVRIIILMGIWLWGNLLFAQNDVGQFFQTNSFNEKWQKERLFYWLVEGGVGHWPALNTQNRPGAESVMQLMDEALFITLLETYQAEVFFGTLSGESSQLQNLEVSRSPCFQFGAGGKIGENHTLLLSFAEMGFQTTESMTLTFFPFESTMPYTEESRVETSFVQRILSAVYQYGIPLGDYIEPYIGLGAWYAATQTKSAEWSLGDITRQLEVSPDAAKTIGGQFSAGIRITPAADFPVGVFGEVGYTLPDFSPGEGETNYRIGLSGKF